MIVYRSDIRVEDYTLNLVPAFHASWRKHISANFRGCPLGRDDTAESAIRDLIARTADESQIHIELWKV